MNSVDIEEMATQVLDGKNDLSDLEGHTLVYICDNNNKEGGSKIDKVF